MKTVILRTAVLSPVSVRFFSRRNALFKDNDFVECLKTVIVSGNIYSRKGWRYEGAGDRGGIQSVP